MAETWVINETVIVSQGTTIWEEIPIKFNWYNGSSIVEKYNTELGGTNIEIYYSSSCSRCIFAEDTLSRFSVGNDYFSNYSVIYDDLAFLGSYSWNGLSSEQKLLLRTITFDTSPTGDLLTWLQANGTLTPSSSPSTADKLQDLIDIKQDIKEAIENKGVDLTGVEFDGYAGKIDEIETGGAPQGETWVINDRTWVCQLDGFDISFTSNNETFTSFWPNQPSAHNLQFGDKYVVTATSKDTSAWIDGNGEYTTYELTPYKIVTFETAPTGDLLTWLQANAVKQ